MSTESKRYEVPPGPPHKTCAECGAELWFVKNPDTGKHVPVTAAGVSHYTDCPNPKRFSRGGKR